MQGEWERYPELYSTAEKQDFRCFYCNDDLLQTPGVFAASQWDHFVPRKAGGKEGSNLVLCCRFCNSQKRDDMFDTYDIAKSAISARRESYLAKWAYKELVQKFRRQLQE